MQAAENVVGDIPCRKGVEVVRELSLRIGMFVFDLILWPLSSRGKDISLSKFIHTHAQFYTYILPMGGLCLGFFKFTM